MPPRTVSALASCLSQPADWSHQLHCPQGTGLTEGREGRLTAGKGRLHTLTTAPSLIGNKATTQVDPTVIHTLIFPAHPGWNTVRLPHGQSGNKQ